jgi:DNA-binding response OmpR family regulator
MNDSRITVLLVEDDPADARRIQDALAGTGDNSTGENTFHVEWVMRLDDALERLDREGIEMILLDLTLPDGQGFDVFHQVFEAAPNVLILVLSAAPMTISSKAISTPIGCRAPCITLSGARLPVTHCRTARRASAQ